MARPDSRKDTKMVHIVRIRDGRRQTLSDPVVLESPVTIFLNDVELVTMMCSPDHLDELAVGFLLAEGVVLRAEDIKGVTVDDAESVVWVSTKGKRRRVDDLLSRRLITTACGRGMSFHDASSDKKLRVHSEFHIKPGNLTALMGEFQRMSELYRRTGGVHSAALCRPPEFLAVREDIGRHNAVDKVLGRCALDGVSIRDTLLITSGRISSEMVVKAARGNIPIIVSKSAPTALAVSLAKDFGVTIVGFARGARMNIYSVPQRVVGR